MPDINRKGNTSMDATLIFLLGTAVFLALPGLLLILAHTFGRPEIRHIGRSDVDCSDAVNRHDTHNADVHDVIAQDDATSALKRAEELLDQLFHAEQLENTPTESIYGESLYGPGYVVIAGSTYIEDAGSARLLQQLEEHIAVHPELHDHPIFGLRSDDDGGSQSTAQPSSAAGAAEDTGGRR